VLLKETDDTAVSGGVHLPKGQQGACGVERRIVQSIDRTPERLTGEELLRLGEGFVCLGQAVPRQGRELRLHRAAPSVSRARMKGVLRQTGSSKMRRAITRGEI